MSKQYQPVKNSPGVYKNTGSNRYLARKKINGKFYKETFDTIHEAKLWRATFDGVTAVRTSSSKFATLKEVWESMQKHHFPLLADSTQDIWRRRYSLLRELEYLRMDEITASVMTSWVQRHVKYFKSQDYEDLMRGNAKRCNLDNELNMFVTIFNWYKHSEQYEKEALALVNPVRKEHKRLGFIKPIPIKDKGISLDAALKFFQFLKPPYRDLALFQYFTASRISEVAGLQWSRIDFKNRKIVVMETVHWDMKTKMFKKLNPHPKNKTPRFVYMTEDLAEILKRQFANKLEDSDFVFHASGAPLNYCTIQVNYRSAQRMANIPFRGTHILRHGMAKLARQIGGGLDAVIAMTGHKDYKLADHYSKLDEDFQKSLSIDIMNHIRQKSNPSPDQENVISISDFARAR